MYPNSGDIKKEVYITGNMEKAELFDRPPPLTPEDLWQTLLCRGGRLVEKVLVKRGIDLTTPLLPAYRWYPRSLFKSLLLVSDVLKKSFYIYEQNAWTSEVPEEMVEDMCFYIPHGSNVENPIEDDQFMARIGAKQIGRTFWAHGDMPEYELNNKETGTRFKFGFGLAVWVDVYTNGLDWFLQRMK